MSAIQRIARLRDDIAGDHGQIRLQFIQHVDGVARVPDAQPGADVKIAQLADAESYEVGMKVRDRQIDLFDMKVDPLDDGAERRHGERRGNGDGSRRVDQARGVAANARARPGRPDSGKAGRWRTKPPPSYPRGFRPR